MRRWLLISVISAASAVAVDSYQQTIEHWRQQHETTLKADGGWLTVTGLFWLKPGENRAGSDPSNEIALPRGPAHLGEFQLRNGAVSFRPERRGSSSTILKPDTDQSISVNDLSLFVIHRGERYAIRLKDKQSKLRREFTGLHWFPVKEEYRITAKFVPFEKPVFLTVPNILGETTQEPSPGYAVFTLQGHEYRLQPVLDENELFFIFRDLTTGKETYPSGRFLYASPAKDRKVVLDFNKAENPPCAFTPYATCPLPPPQNRLAVRIEAGELNYGHHASDSASLR